MTSLHRAAIALVLCSVFVASAGAESPLQQSFELRVPVPPTPVAVAGASQLVYELHLANLSSETLVPQHVEVFDAEGASVIIDIGNDELERRLYRPGAPSAGTALRTIAPGTFGVVYIELALQEGVLPRALAHRVTVLVAGDARKSAVVEGARVAIPTEPPVVLTPPLSAGPWAAIYDPSWTRGHRRVFYTIEGRARIPGRFAIDWIKLDADGRFAHGDEDQVRNWHGYGADVLAVADGVVAAARDVVAESATVSGNPDHPLEDATGNYIALDIGHGRYAFYEHLQPGSVRVGPGERVRRGDVIGSLGFTGDSTGPHLHFHVADGNSPLGAEGVPFVFDDYTVRGVYDDFDKLGVAPWTPIGGGGGSHRTRELPASNVVVEFATSDTSWPDRAGVRE